MSKGQTYRRDFLKSVGAFGLTGLPGCLKTPVSSASNDSPVETKSSTLTDAPAKTRVTDSDFVVSNLNVSTSKTEPTKRYFLRITKVYTRSSSGDVQTVRDVSEVVDPAVRATLKDILRSGKIWRDELPERFRDVVQEVDAFKWDAYTDEDDRATHWGIGIYRAFPDREPVVEFAAELVDERITPEDPGAITFSLKNTGEQTQTVFSGTVPPFSLLWAETPGQTGRALLWRDYIEEGCVDIYDIDREPRMSICDIGKNTPIEPGETLKRTYELRANFDREPLAKWGFNIPGQYTVDETLTYHREAEVQGPSTHVEWGVEFDLSVA